MNYPLTADDMDKLQKFQQRINQEPPFDSVEATFDKKASTVVMSHLEMTFDELFFGQWHTLNFQWKEIMNEIQGSIELVVVHPVTGERITRTGAASIVITVDAVPAEIKDNAQERNLWATTLANKKAEALRLAFPKLKAECFKNAALSHGKIFGRDLNRKNKDAYKPFKLSQVDTGLKQLPEASMTIIEGYISDGIEEFELNERLEPFMELISPEQKEKIDSLLKQREA